MTLDFTPTTEQVRSGYASDPEAEYRDPIGYAAYERGLVHAFNRWLAAHDAEVRRPLETRIAEAVRAGIEAGEPGSRSIIEQRALNQMAMLNILRGEPTC